MKRLQIIALAVFCFIFLADTADSAPRRDKGAMIDYKNPFWEEIKKTNEEFEQKKTPKKLDFKMDFSGMDLPASSKDFKQQWHNEPVAQAQTNTCWSYSGTSFFESEIYRLQNKKLKLSEMFTVYWEYIEKARRFVREKGNSYFAEGSQANAVVNAFDKYGCVPLEAYTGLKPGQKFHNHEKMYHELNDYLQFVKKNKFWNEQVVLETIKSILNSYIGEPPTTFSFEGKSYSPKEFLSQVTKINTKDYVDVLSLMEHGYWKKAVHDVPDNWWHSDVYYNVPLDDYMSAIKNAIQNGFTMFIGGDVSETGYYSYSNVAMIPSYDIPSEYIDEYARQFRYSNGTTGDDHGIHLVGWKEHNGSTWFLIKDSGSGARNGKNSGYYFYHEDYVKLKMMNILVHKDGIKDLLVKFELNKVK